MKILEKEIHSRLGEYIVYGLKFSVVLMDDGRMLASYNGKYYSILAFRKALSDIRKAEKIRVGLEKLKEKIYPILKGALVRGRAIIRI
jgi:hypothetical protein